MRIIVIINIAKLPVIASENQHQLSPFCVEGHFTEPYEQYTQQSSALVSVRFYNSHTHKRTGRHLPAWFLLFGNHIQGRLELILIRS